MLAGGSKHSTTSNINEERAVRLAQPQRLFVLDWRWIDSQLISTAQWWLWMSRVSEDREIVQCG